MRLLVITPQLAIPCSELHFTYARSGGPGGQNVNKVNSKATLRWNVAASAGLPPHVRAALATRCRRRMTSDGDLLVTSQRFRDAGRNAADCLEKLRQILAQIAAPPTVRKPTRPTRASKSRRLEQKQHTRRKKEARRPDQWSS
jgi:ribosome-associated protein